MWSRSMTVWILESEKSVKGEEDEDDDDVEGFERFEKVVLLGFLLERLEGRGIEQWSLRNREWASAFVVLIYLDSEF